MIKYYKDENGVIVKWEGSQETHDELSVFNPEYILIPTEDEILAFESTKLAEYKSGKCKEIDKRTDELIAEGFDHNDVHFNCADHDQRNMNTLGLLQASGVDMADQYFRASGEDYYFTSNADFAAVLAKGVIVVHDNVVSGGTLKNTINSCADITEINAVIDNRQLS